ncbi:hypothetical protein [Nostoc cycadae]|nr:hypothetical protein [Nostoc cycadae]
MSKQIVYFTQNYAIAVPVTDIAGLPYLQAIALYILNFVVFSQAVLKLS